MRPTKKTNLRAPATRFIGRVAELTRLGELLGGGARLITISGPAGTGKSRLAEAFGLRSHGEFGAQGGVWLCELAEIRTLEELCSAIGHTLGVPPSPAASAEEAVRRLGDAIAARGPVLVILDNFEQLVETSAASVGSWLAAAPDVHFLVTSREQLRVGGEVRFELGPMHLPDDDRGVEKSEAAQLFVERVRATDPSFAVEPANAGTIATLVRRLEGIPLAIELAASRVELFGLGGLIEHLDRRLDVLTRANRDVQDRHATLRAAIGWSWELLDAAERNVLAQCAVFRGGFAAAAAEAVLDPGDGQAVLALVQSLRDKSLLRRYEPAHTSDHPRFGLYESVRAYADEQLTGESRTAVERRHTAYFLDAGERWATQAAGPDAIDALTSLDRARENLLAIHGRALAGDDHTTALRSALVLDAVVSVRGPLSSHLELLEQTMAAATDADAPALVARTARARGKARLQHGLAAGVRDLDRALEIAKKHGLARLQSEVLADLAVHHHHRREMSTARVLYERALEHARAADDRALQGRVLGNLGALNHDVGAFDEALDFYRTALELLQEVGSQRMEAIHVANLGILEQERGELGKARAHFEAALDLLRGVGDRRLLALVAGNLGNLEHEEGRAQEARRCHEEALGMLREVGDRRSEALSLGRLGRANATLAWLDDARSCLSAADRLLTRYPDPLLSATIDVDHGFVDVAEARHARARNDDDEAERLMAAARERIEAVSTPGADGGLSWRDQSDDIRTAVRILEQELANLAAPARAEEPRTRPALVVGPQARWMQPPGGDPQDLSRRKAIRLILDALVENHRESPGGGLPLEALLSAGWPGERVVASAGANRVYVALTTLRKLGLRGHVLSQDDGYLLDPALPVERSAMPWSDLQG